MFFSKWFKRKETSISMNLQSFIAESLVQICGGVRDAQKAITRIPYEKDDEKYFTPYIVPSPRGGREKERYDVQFDVAVTVSNTMTSKGDLGIKSEILIAGVGGSTSAERVDVNRLRFAIPIIYPSMPVPHPGSEK